MVQVKASRVALLVPQSTSWSRRLIRGVLRYTRKHEPWRLWIEAWTPYTPIRLPPQWHGEGIIAWMANHAMARHVAAAAVPTVNVSAIELKGVNLPQITTDMRASGRLAVEHFFDRGFRHFAYCGLQRRSYVEHHYEAFAEVLAEAGHECPLYKPGAGTGSTSSRDAQQEDLMHWLKHLPKPVAILTWATTRGRDVIDACRSVGLLVPEQVAVLGGDEDELLCDVCNPPLSGIMVGSEQIGHEAAALLDRLMRGRQPPKAPIFVEPIGVVARQSTDTLAIDDDDLVQAIAFIRSHAANLIQVKDVLRAVPISRRRLERRFQEVLRRTPAAEIRRVHLERAKQLLAETDMSVPDIAAASGFGSPEYLAYVFKSETALTPQKYRSNIRGS